MNQTQAPQRAYPNQYNQSYNQTAPEKKHNFLAMGLILIILLSAIGLYFIMKPKIIASIAPEIKTPTTKTIETPKDTATNEVIYTNTKHVPNTTSKEVVISNLKLCRGFQEGECLLPYKNSFFKGSDFIISAEINTPSTSFFDGEYFKGYYVDIEIINSTGGKIYSKENYERATIGADSKFIPLTLTFVTEDTDASDEYQIILTVHDKFSDKLKSANISMVIL